jgi:hypothetical protein
MVFALEVSLVKSDICRTNTTLATGGWLLRSGFDVALAAWLMLVAGNVVVMIYDPNFDADVPSKGDDLDDGAEGPPEGGSLTGEAV